MVDHCCLVVRAFNDGINWAGFLAKTAVNTLSHVYIVSGGSSRAIRTWLTLDSDCHCWAGGCAQFTSNTSEYIFSYLSSPVAYLLRACSPLNLGESGPFS